ncbi:hypothetical protein ACTA71_012552 [Dictyostelium dimigraforme]
MKLIKISDYNNINHNNNNHNNNNNKTNFTKHYNNINNGLKNSKWEQIELLQPGKVVLIRSNVLFCLINIWNIAQISSSISSVLRLGYNLELKTNSIPYITCINGSIGIGKQSGCSDSNFACGPYTCYPLVGVRLIPTIVHNLVNIIIGSKNEQLLDQQYQDDDNKETKEIFSTTSTSISDTPTIV